MYEMATGEVLFTTGNLMGLLVAVATKAPRPPSEVYPAIDPAFEAVILKALSKNRSLRQQTAQQLRQELLALLPAAQRRQTRRWSPR
jgi:serine/threonine-protein kinase